MLKIQRILLVSTLLRGRGGMETVVDLFAKGMERKGVLVKVVFLGKRKKDKHSFQWCKNLDYQVLLPSYPFNDPIRWALEKDKLIKILNEWNPDITIGLNNSAIDRLVSARKSSKQPFLIFSWVHFSLSILRRTRTILKADYHLAISSGIKNELVSGLNISPEKIHIVWNPLIKDKYLITPDSHQLNFLFVGRLTEQKDPKKLIYSFSQIPGKWLLHIVGAGEMKDELVNLAKSLKINEKIVWHGWQPEPWKYIKENVKHITCLIMTSKNEGFPMVLIEAISRGIFCISTDCPTGPKDIINPQNGILIPVGERLGFVKAINFVIHNRLPSPEEISESVGQFSLDNYTENVLNFFAKASGKAENLERKRHGILPCLSE